MPPESQESSEGPRGAQEGRERPQRSLDHPRGQAREEFGDLGVLEEELLEVGSDLARLQVERELGSQDRVAHGGSQQRGTSREERGRKHRTRHVPSDGLDLVQGLGSGLVDRLVRVDDGLGQLAHGHQTRARGRDAGRSDLGCGNRHQDAGQDIGADNPGAEHFLGKGNGRDRAGLLE